MPSDTAESSSNSALSEQFSDASMAVTFDFVRSFVRSFVRLFVSSLVSLLIGLLVGLFIYCSLKTGTRLSKFDCSCFHQCAGDG